LTTAAFSVNTKLENDFRIFHIKERLEILVNAFVRTMEDKGDVLERSENGAEYSHKGLWHLALGQKL